MDPNPKLRKRKRVKRRKAPPIFVRDVPSSRAFPNVPPAPKNDFHPPSSSVMDSKHFFDRFNQLLDWRLPDGTNMAEQGFNRFGVNFSPHREGGFSGNDSNNAPFGGKRKVSDPFDLRNRLHQTNKRWKESDDVYFKKAVVHGERSDGVRPVPLSSINLSGQTVGGQLMMDRFSNNFEPSGAHQRTDYSRDLVQRERNFDGDQWTESSRRNDAGDWNNPAPDRVDRGNEFREGERRYGSPPAHWIDNRQDDRQVKEYWPDRTLLDRPSDHINDNFDRWDGVDFSRRANLDRPPDHVSGNFNMSCFERRPERSTSFELSPENLGDNYNRNCSNERGYAGSMKDEYERAREYRQSIPADQVEPYFQSHERSNRDGLETYPKRPEYKSYSGLNIDYCENSNSSVMGTSGHQHHLKGSLPSNQSFEKNNPKRDGGFNERHAKNKLNWEEDLTATIQKENFARITNIEGDKLRSMLIDLVMKCDDPEHTPEFKNSGIARGGFGFVVDCSSKLSLDWLMKQTLPPLNNVPLIIKRNKASETVKISAFAPKCNRTREEVFKLIKLQNARKGFNFDNWSMRSYQSSPRGVYMAFNLSLDEARKFEELGCQLSFELKCLTFKLSATVEIHSDML